MTNDLFKPLDCLPDLRNGAGKEPAGGGCIIEVVSYLYDRSWTDETPCVHRVLRSAAIRVNDSLPDDERQKLWALVPRLMNTAIADPDENKRVSVGLAIWCAEQVFHLVNPKRQVKARKAIDAAKAWLDCPCEKHRKAASAADASAYAYAYDAASAYTYAAAAADAYTSAASASAAAADASAYASAYAYAYADAYAASAADAYTYAAYTYAASAASASAADASARLQMLEGLLDEYERLTARTETAEITEAQWRDLCEVMGAKA